MALRHSHGTVPCAGATQKCKRLGTTAKRTDLPEVTFDAAAVVQSELPMSALHLGRNCTELLRLVR